jgi:hypothetical protein
LEEGKFNFTKVGRHRRIKIEDGIKEKQKQHLIEIMQFEAGMMHRVRFKAILDSHFIYPWSIRNLLLWFALYKLFTPKWSENICDQCENVIVR